MRSTAGAADDACDGAADAARAADDACDRAADDARAGCLPTRPGGRVARTLSSSSSSKKAARGGMWREIKRDFSRHLDASCLIFRARRALKRQNLFRFARITRCRAVIRTNLIAVRIAAPREAPLFMTCSPITLCRVQETNYESNFGRARGHHCTAGDGAYKQTGACIKGRGHAESGRLVSPTPATARPCGTLPTARTEDSSRRLGARQGGRDDPPHPE